MTSFKLNILGIRGVPAQHGGFETFAEKLCLYLVDKGWDVTVYCQEDGAGASWESEWCGVKRIHIPVNRQGAAGTVIFDWLATRDALSRDGLFLTLGYNTAIFNLLQRLKGQTNVINMDGMHFPLKKWAVRAIQTHISPSAPNNEILYCRRHPALLLVIIIRALNADKTSEYPKM